MDLSILGQSFQPIKLAAHSRFQVLDCKSYHFLARLAGAHGILTYDRLAYTWESGIHTKDRGREERRRRRRGRRISRGVGEEDNGGEMFALIVSESLVDSSTTGLCIHVSFYMYRSCNFQKVKIRKNSIWIQCIGACEL